MSIASEISRLQGAKADIKTAIEGKGVTVPSAAKISAYPLLINAIPSGGGSTLITKNISANGTYNASSDSADGYSQVNVAVPASAVDSGTKQITSNGTGQDVVGYAAVDVAVPNSYSQSDEGKVVSDGALVSQTSKNINSNGTHSTVTNNQVVVAVPNSYSASDEGKVVSNGALVAQTAHADVTPTTSDQTIDTTTNNSIKVKGDADLVASNIKKDVEIFGVTGSYEGGGGGSGFTTIASGTSVGSNNTDQSGRQRINVGKKMPQTDFYVLIWAPDGTEFAYSSNRQIIWMYGEAKSGFGHYDLVSNPSSTTARNFISEYSVDSNDSGTITNRSVVDPVRDGKQIYNGSVSSAQPNTTAIYRQSDHFEILIGISNSAYIFPSSVTYNYEVVYFGTSPSTDIIEIT